ncbi:MAG: hypothetical protein JWM57_2139 [Phycisphaerales bacterium]|nr:hypothetical protein [Phycisphaerales bacterium]
MTRAPRLSLIGLLAFAAIAPAAPPAPPTTGPVLPPGEESSRPALVAEQASLPKLEPQRIGQMLSIVVEDQFLHISPRGPQQRGQFAVQVPDWPGFVTLQQFGPGTMKLDHVMLADNDTTEARTSVIVRPDYLQLVRDTETLTSTRSVTLMQSRMFADASGDPVRLSVKDAPKEDGRPAPPTVMLSAPTFSDLVRDHPAAVRDALLPILRDLGAAGVLRGSDPARAWQALGSALPADTKVAAQIDALLKQLDADDFAQREKAEAAMEALGPPAAVEIRRRDLAKLSPDARSSVENALRKSEPLTPARADQLGHDVPFLLDTLLLDDPHLTAAAAKRLAEITGKPIDLPADLTPAERERRIAAYTATLGPATQPAPATRESTP